MRTPPGRGVDVKGDFGESSSNAQAWLVDFDTCYVSGVQSRMHSSKVKYMQCVYSMVCLQRVCSTLGEYCPLVAADGSQQYEPKLIFLFLLFIQILFDLCFSSFMIGFFGLFYILRCFLILFLHFFTFFLFSWFFHTALNPDCCNICNIHSQMHDR